MAKEFAEKVAVMMDTKINWAKMEAMLDRGLTIPEDPIKIFVYELDGEVVGFFAGAIGEAIISDDIIFQEINFIFREDKQGYAPFLIKGVKKLLEDKVDGIVLAHMVDNKKLVRLYNKLGFFELESHYLWKTKR